MIMSLINEFEVYFLLGCYEILVSIYKCIWDMNIRGGRGGDEKETFIYFDHVTKLEFNCTCFNFFATLVLIFMFEERMDFNCFKVIFINKNF